MQSSRKRMIPRTEISSYSPFSFTLRDVFNDIWPDDVQLNSKRYHGLSEYPDHWEYRVDVPGVDKENIDISISPSGLITISCDQESEPQDGETVHFRRQTKNQFTFTVPDGVDQDEISAHLENGVLTLELPKTSVSSRKIDIE